MYFSHTATDERENINAVMQHIGMETCIRFKDISEDDDAEQNQEYDDEELRPAYAEDNKNTDIFPPSTKKIGDEDNSTTTNLNDNENDSKSAENKLDMRFVDRLFEKSTIANDDTMMLLRKGTSATKGSSTTKSNSTAKGSNTTKDSSGTQGSSTAQTQGLKSKLANTVHSMTTLSKPRKVAKQVRKENSSNVTKVLKKPTSELKRKKQIKLMHKDKSGMNLTSKAIKHTDKKAAAQIPGKKI